MTQLNLPNPADPRQGKRTGFSFDRFAIPELAGYQGRAIYMDADMLVFSDIRELWEIPFNGAKVIIQDDIPEDKQATDRKGAPKKRIKQCAVMLLDCGNLNWKAEEIIKGLDGKYTYEDLMYHLCILEESEIKYAVPYEWNSLEFYDENTRLLHYTDMYTQPWVSLENENGYLWINEVQRMLENGSLEWPELEQEVDLGHFRPSLLHELKMDRTARPLDQETVEMLSQIDTESGFIKHASVYAAKRVRKKAIKEFEERQAQLPPPSRISILRDRVARLFSPNH